MIFGRTGLRIGVSRAENHEQSHCDVQKFTAPQNNTKNHKKLNNIRQQSETNPNHNFFRGRKIKCRGSSETRFDQV